MDGGMRGNHMSYTRKHSFYPSLELLALIISMPGKFYLPEGDINIMKKNIRFQT